MYSDSYNTSLRLCFYSRNHNQTSTDNMQCLLCRLVGLIILIISIFSFILNIRYLIWYRRQKFRNKSVLSLFLSSLLVLIISVPIILVQLFTYYRYFNEILCRIEGFNSFLCGCSCMLAYIVLSVNRYLLLYESNQNFFCRYSTIICWLLSLSWTLPPVFDYMTSYVPEGLGFHCSIKWNNLTRSNRFYILFSFIFIYFIPLFILVTVNILLQKRIRNTYLHYDHYCAYQQQTNSSLSLQEKQDKFHRHVNIQMFSVREANSRKNLRIQYRFVQGILYLVGAYLFAWTPYAIIALLQMFHAQFINQHQFFITLSAFIAKLSVILSPLVYLSIMKFRLFKQLLFQK